VARISWGEGAELVLERRPPSVIFAGHRVKLPPAAFLQASVEAEQAILADVLDIINDAGNVADLFSGLGTFSLPLMAKNRVDAFDGNASAIAALTAAAGGDRLDAHVRDLFRRPLRPDELAHYGAVVIDPPRAGARGQIEQLAVSSVPVIAMVSCNPATFARDARTLVDGGYALEWVRPVDQFVWSAEVEMVAAFRRS
jgi:23S rRNA (uracil1939-C5)-methyltransferase